METGSIKYLIPERITRYKAALQGNEVRQTSRIVDEIRHEFMADHAHMIFQERQAEWKKFLNEFYQAYGNPNELLMADRAQRQDRRESRHTETKIKQEQLAAEKERTEPNIRRPAVNPHIMDAGVTSTAGLDAMNNLIAESYDGFICEEDGTIVEINAFHPNQIKSATDNNGNYSSTNDDIRFRIGDTERLRAGQQITFTRANPTVTFNAIKRRLNKTEIDFDEDHARTGSKYLSFSKNGVDYTLRSANHTKSYVGARKETTGIELHSYADGEIEFVDIDLSESQMRADDVFALINEIDAMKDSKKTFRDYVALRERPSQSLGDTPFTQALDETVHNILVRERNRLWDETFEQILTERPLEDFTASNGFIVKDKGSWMTVDSPKGWQGKTKQHAEVAKAEYLQSNIYSGNKEAYEAASKAADRTTEDINRALQHWTEGDLRFRAVYHGSPHDFDRFDHSFMGFGKGNQSFGWGTYVTEVNSIARSYAEPRRGRIRYKDMSMKEIEHLHQEGVPPYSVVLSVIGKMEIGYSFAEARTGLEADWRSALEYDEKEADGELAASWKKNLAELASLSGADFMITRSRNLYTVEIPEDGGSNYLKWNEALTEEQKQMIAGRGEKEGYGDYRIAYRNENGDLILNGSTDSGELVYKELRRIFEGDAKAASDFLSRAGFSGIEYPTQSTTGGRPDGAKNYVIFNGQDVQITDHVRLRNAKMNVATLQIRRNEAEINVNEKMEAVKELSAKLKLDVRIFWDLASIPPEIPTDRRNSELRGWYNAPDGSISIVLSTHTSIADIQRTILHEGVAHKGLDDLLGREKANQLYERIFDSLPLIEKEKLRHQYTYKADAGAEYVAKLAEDNIQPNMVELILAVIRDFFREVLQISLKLSDMDIKALLYHSREQLSQRSSIKSKSACTSALDKLRKEVRENGKSAHLSKQQMVRKIH